MDFVEAVLKILRIIAPTLRVLFISFECRWIRLPLLAPAGTIFPTLTSLMELSLNYQAPTDAVFNYYMDHFPAAALPFLTRLDISGLKLLSYPHHFGSIAKIAPSLTHLHLPAEMAMNIYTPFADSPEDQNMPAGLHQMLVELNGPHIHEGWYPSLECMHCYLLVMTADKRFIVLQERSDYTWKRNCEHLEREWIGRINRGKGGWDEISADSGWFGKFLFPILQAEIFFPNFISFSVKLTSGYRALRIRPYGAVI